MRKIYWNNRLAKVLLAFSSCHTITIGPFVFSKRSEDRITRSVRDHEYIHVRLKNTGKAYKAVSFEKEVYNNEDDPDYPDNGNYFGWRKYL